MGSIQEQCIKMCIAVVHFLMRLSKLDILKELFWIKYSFNTQFHNISLMFTDFCDCTGLARRTTAM